MIHIDPRLESRAPQFFRALKKLAAAIDDAATTDEQLNLIRAACENPIFRGSMTQTKQCALLDVLHEVARHG